ncbi:MAG: adenylyltransferase/cytidyltransferase family protein [Oscillospiraceae bacterium]|nr:adenylyltransferase/cytidyltransferase family protein [Oscillospiraceae bacterium]
MKKPYELGIIVGRFQTFHLGHRSMIDRALELCRTVGVFIGSSQESGTGKNPFTYEMRKRILRRVYGNRIRIYPLPDIGVGNVAAWGDYVLDNVQARFGRTPDLFVSGKEGRRADWFDSDRGRAVAELAIPKTIDISASTLRELLEAGDFETWREYTDSRLWDLFPELREAVLAARGNTGTASI